MQDGRKNKYRKLRLVLEERKTRGLKGGGKKVLKNICLEIEKQIFDMIIND